MTLARRFAPEPLHANPQPAPSRVCPEMRGLPSGPSSMSRTGRRPDRCRAPCCLHPWDSRCCPTCRTGRGTNTACGSASGGFWKPCPPGGLSASFAVNGTACELYREACEAAHEAGWDFMGHGYIQRPMHPRGGPAPGDRRHHRGDPQDDWRGAARLGKPRADRDRRDARSARGSGSNTWRTGCSTTSPFR